jgi:hypothetical protein
MHLEIILYTTLHKDIGLKSFKYSAFFVLGIRAMIVSFEPSGSTPSEKKCLIAVVIS